MDINNSRASPVSIYHSSSEEILSASEVSTHQTDEGVQEVVKPIHKAVADGKYKWQYVHSNEALPRHIRQRNTVSESSSSSGSVYDPIEEESMQLYRTQSSPKERMLEFPKFNSHLSSAEGKEILHKIILPLIGRRLKEVLQVMRIPQEELDHWESCSKGDLNLFWRNIFEDRPCTDWVELLDAVTKVFGQDFALGAGDLIKQNESDTPRQRQPSGANLEQQRALEETAHQLRSSLEKAQKNTKDSEAKIARLQKEKENLTETMVKLEDQVSELQLDNENLKERMIELEDYVSELQMGKYNSKGRREVNELRKGGSGDKRSQSRRYKHAARKVSSSRRL